MPHKGNHFQFTLRTPLMAFLEIMQQIGQLFLLRTNINSVGSVLDSPVGLAKFPYITSTMYLTPIFIAGGVLGTFIAHPRVLP